MEVVAEVQGHTLDERIKWIEQQRAKGNECFKNGDIAQALDEYMRCLCALDFKSCRGYIDEINGLSPEDKELDSTLHITPEREQLAQQQMKVPVMNNMA